MNLGERGQSVHVSLPEALDDLTLAEVGSELRRLAADTAHHRIVLDAGDVKLVGSAGLGVLAAVRLVTNRRGARVEVVNCNPGLLGLLRIARVDASAADRSDVSDAAAGGDWTPWWGAAAANA